MWKKTRLLSILFMLSAFVLCWPSVGGCSAIQTYTISASELETLQRNLDVLEQHNKTLRSILSTSGEELTAALNALTESQMELEKLRIELQTCKAEAQSAQKSLETANLELQKAAESFRQSEIAHEKTEGRLRNQRTIWQVVACVLAGVAVTSF